MPRLNPRLAHNLLAIFKDKALLDGMLVSYGVHVPSPKGTLLFGKVGLTYSDMQLVIRPDKPPKDFTVDVQCARLVGPEAVVNAMLAQTSNVLEANNNAIRFKAEVRGKDYRFALSKVLLIAVGQVLRVGIAHIVHPNRNGDVFQQPMPSMSICENLHFVSSEFPEPEDATAAKPKTEHQGIPSFA